MIRNIDVAAVRAFLMVAEQGSVTGAARILNLTQAAVSQQISRLERALAVDLLSRDHRGARLTAAGERFLPRARSLMAANDAAWATMVEERDRPRIRFGAPPDLVEALPAFFARLRVRLPQVELLLTSVPSRAVMQALREERLDIALVQQELDDRSGRVVTTDPLEWVGVAGGQAYQRRPAPVSIGSDICVFRQAILDAFERSGQAWRPVLDNAGYQGVIAALRADTAVAPFQRSTIPSGMEIIRSDSLPVLPALAIAVHRSSQPQTATLHEFERLLVEEVSGWTQADQGGVVTPITRGRRSA